jgi:hypothetical protein
MVTQDNTAMSSVGNRVGLVPPLDERSLVAHIEAVAAIRIDANWHRAGDCIEVAFAAEASRIDSPLGRPPPSRASLSPSGAGP